MTYIDDHLKRMAKNKEEKSLEKKKKKQSIKYAKQKTNNAKKKNSPKKKPVLRVKNLLQKRKTTRLFLYEEKRLRKKLVEQADTIFAKYIKNRDKGRWCVSKWAVGCQNTTANCCHWIGRGYYSHRRDERNCAWWCVSCNQHNKQEHGILFTNYLCKKFGQYRVDEQLKIRSMKKPSIDELLEVIEKYTIS